MANFRKLTTEECALLGRNGVECEDWSLVDVSEDFEPSQLRQCSLSGIIRLESGAKIRRSRIENYHIAQQSLIEGVTSLECRHRSSFGCGVKVATINECGGRSISIYDSLSAQVAYLGAVYRHRPLIGQRLEEMAQKIAHEKEASVGYIGKGCRITGARFIREVNIGDNVEIDGATILQNGTILSHSFVGMDVKAYDFIMAEFSHIANGVMIEKCFLGESSIFDKNFTAADSLFFANTHCENGEAASIFAGPYTVTHHKSSLLIAGLFSFFNAGSGANQSNHLFKSGAVHQSVHLRGCKFASSAYIMSPALEGPFTMVMGHHSFHHDTSIFPYSYLIEKEGASFLMPGANLTSYGSVRDTEKWLKRDKRQIQRDVISFEEYNPYITQKMLQAIDALHTLHDAEPDAPIYHYNKVQIRSSSLHKGLALYNKAIVASLGEMLSKGRSTSRYKAYGKWVDIAGQYISKQEVDAIIEDIEQGVLQTPQDIDNRFRLFKVHYEDYAHSWAEGVYASILGHQPSQAEIDDVISAGENAHSTLRMTAEKDRQRDCSLDMSVGYGLDTDTLQEQYQDYYAVRGLKQE